MPRTNPFPTVGTVDKISKSIRAVRQELAPHEHLLTLADRKRMVRPRTGSDRITTLVLDIAAKYGFELSNMPSAGIRDAQAAAARTQSLHTEARALYQSVTDTVFSAQSAAWSGTTAYYSILSSIAERDESLRIALEPVTEFFARRSSAVREDQSVTRAERKAEKAIRKALRLQVTQAEDAVARPPAISHRTTPKAHPAQFGGLPTSHPRSQMP